MHHRVYRDYVDLPRAMTLNIAMEMVCILKASFLFAHIFYSNFEGTPGRSTIFSLFKRDFSYFILSFALTLFDGAFAVSRHPDFWCIFRRPTVYLRALRLLGHTRVEFFFCHFPDKVACQSLGHFVGAFRWRKTNGYLVKWMYRQPMDWLEEVTTS